MWSVAGEFLEVLAVFVAVIGLCFSWCQGCEGIDQLLCNLSKAIEQAGIQT
jgi:hypothetical protein